MPYWAIDPDVQPLIEHAARQMIAAADHAKELLYQALRNLHQGAVTSKKANGYFSWKHPSEGGIDRSKAIIAGPLETFWADTRDPFFERIDALVSLYEGGEATPERVRPIGDSWVELLRHTIRDLFDTQAPIDTILMHDVRSATCARLDLLRASSPKSKKFNSFADLAIQAQE